MPLLPSTNGCSPVALLKHESTPIVPNSSQKVEWPVCFIFFSRRCNVQVFFLTYLFAFTATYRNVPTGTACVRLSSNSAGSDAVPTFVQDYETESVFRGNVPDGVESGDHFKVQLGDDGDVLVKCPDGKPARVCGGSSHVHVSLTVYFSILFPPPNIL